jgi:antitoxin (DNA-binding transcriptional repressor) of toxin-antitoxin stability system
MSYVGHVVMVKIADLKNNLSRHLVRVRRGAEIVVYDRDTPIARIVPFTPAATDAHSKLAGATRAADLARQGIVSTGNPRALAEWTKRHRPVARPAGAPSAVDLLLDVRRTSER